MDWSEVFGPDIWVFAVGDSSKFFVDPTRVVRAYLPEIFSNSQSLPAEDFLNSLAILVPVLDSGNYRSEVEASLDKRYWREILGNNLSMSLSLALHRLESLRTYTAFGKGRLPVPVYNLIGTGYRTWRGF